MNNKEAKYIDKVEIEGLFGRYNVNWKLHSDVNILVGENGTGKSSILKCIINMIRLIIHQFKTKTISEVLIFDAFSLIKLDFDNGKSKKLIKNMNDNLEATFKFDFDDNKETKEKKDDNQSKGFLVYFINTFDSEIFIERLKRKEELKTNLDALLDGSIDDYVEYQLNLNKKIVRDKQDPIKVFEKLELFNKTVNRLFSNTNKYIDQDENRIVFNYNDKSKIYPYQLSSGEKQLLIILLTVLCQDEKPSILLMDEPEISLHLSWQYELIEIIRTLNPNCQVIIVTHSPSIFNDGLRDKVFWIEDILKPIKEKHND
jgi:ABC-type Mn2+/Zn2+ transport system ATPase subunit